MSTCRGFGCERGSSSDRGGFVLRRLLEGSGLRFLWLRGTNGRADYGLTLHHGGKHRPCQGAADSRPSPSVRLWDAALPEVTAKPPNPGASPGACAIKP